MSVASLSTLSKADPALSPHSKYFQCIGLRNLFYTELSKLWDLDSTKPLTLYNNHMASITA